MYSKKNVFLVRNIAPGDYGGGEKYQIELARVLKKNGFSPKIFTSSVRLIEEARANGIEVIRAPYCRYQNWSGWRNFLFPVFCVWQIRLRHWYKMQIRKYDPCVLNIQSRDELIGATLAALSCDKKIIWTDHADFRTWSLINVDKKIKNQIGKWILRCARKVDAIIVVSVYEKKWLERIIKPRKLNNLTVVRNGVVDEYQRYIGIKSKKNSFCYVGRVVKDKGVFELIEAFRKVADRAPGVVLDIYGDGEDFDECKKVAQGDERIIFHGYTNDAIGGVAKADVFVFPSYHEGLPLALLEAAMMRKKIVATDISGNREVVGDGKTGLLVPVKNVDKLAEAMIWMLEHKKQADKLAENARKYYKENFDFDKIFVEKMLPLYNIKKEKK